MHMIRYLPLLLLLNPVFVAAQDTVVSDTSSVIVFTGDDPVASMLDSLSQLRIFNGNGYTKTITARTTTDDSIPVFPDSVYRARILEMNGQSPIEYIYNGHVRQFIDLYACKKRELTSRILGLSELYFPLFEEQLDRHNLPLELKYLAVIESALNPTANSRAGAKGLWQFMYGTGKVYGLRVTSLVDDRYDPYKATIAACEHLKDLFDIYGNWSLALAAYNSGAGNVNKAIRRSGGHKNFWVIYPYLPRETRSYVPAFIAASYVLTYAESHRIVPIEPTVLHYDLDTVAVRSILTFDQISGMLNIPKEEIAFLNPTYKQQIIPASRENPCFLRLRKKDVGNFITNEGNIYAYQSQQARERDSLEKIVEESMKATRYYIVKSGDNLGSIAARNHMTVSQLKQLNGLRSNTIYPKQRLLVFNSPGQRVPANVTAVSSPAKTPPASTPKPNAAIQSSSSKSSSPSGNNGNFFHYTIKPGDNLWDLAQKYDCTVSEIKRLNIITNANRLRPGQQIKIPK